jgi:hypothetical protein
MTDSQWEELLEQSTDKETHECYDGSFIVNGEKVFFGSTAHGDGYFRDNRGNNYSVDAGIIGICPVSIINPDLFFEMKGNDFGKFITFDDNFTIVSDSGQFEIILHSGYSVLVLDTDTYDEEEYEEENYE